MRRFDVVYIQFFLFGMVLTEPDIRLKRVIVGFQFILLALQLLQHVLNKSNEKY